MVRLLDKEREAHLLGALFDLMRHNMADVAPTAWEKAKWLTEVGNALKKAPRQIVLLYCAGKLAGFCMYYVNGGVFMVEELQILREYRSTGVIAALWKFFLRTVPADTQYMEAWADRENAYSQKLLRRLGLEIVDRTTDGQLLHFRGDFRLIPQIQGIATPVRAPFPNDMIPNT